MESVKLDYSANKITASFYEQTGTEQVRVGTSSVEVTPADPGNEVEAVYEEQPIFESRPTYSTSLTVREYTDAASYLADHPDREADCYVFTYVAPAPVITVPQVVTIRQAKLVLLAAGLLDDVDAAVAQADRATKIEWEYATEVNRQWPTLMVLASLMGMTSEALDGLFIEGAKL